MENGDCGNDFSDSRLGTIFPGELIGIDEDQDNPLISGFRICENGISAWIEQIMATVRFWSYTPFSKHINEGLQNLQKGR